MDHSDITPTGTLERMLAAAERLPGLAGYFFYRQLKKRLTARSLPAFNEAVAALRPGDNAVDLGAHVGEFTVRMAATGATVHAFEPLPDAFAQLVANTAALPNVRRYKVAASDRHGFALLHRTGATTDPGTRPSKASSLVR